MALARQLARRLRRTCRCCRRTGPARFAAGHWRDYRDALGEAFALLAPGRGAPGLSCGLSSGSARRTPCTCAATVSEHRGPILAELRWARRAASAATATRTWPGARCRRERVRSRCCASTPTRPPTAHWWPTRRRRSRSTTRAATSCTGSSRIFLRTRAKSRREVAATGVTRRGKPAGSDAGGARGLNDTGWFAGDAEMGGEYFGYDGPVSAAARFAHAPLFLPRVRAGCRETRPSAEVRRSRRAACDAGPRARRSLDVRTYSLNHPPDDSCRRQDRSECCTTQGAGTANRDWGVRVAQAGNGQPARHMGGEIGGKSVDETVVLHDQAAIAGSAIQQQAKPYSVWPIIASSLRARCALAMRPSRSRAGASIACKLEPLTTRPSNSSACQRHKSSAVLRIAPAPPA